MSRAWPCFPWSMAALHISKLLRLRYWKRSMSLGTLGWCRCQQICFVQLFASFYQDVSKYCDNAKQSQTSNVQFASVSHNLREDKTGTVYPSKYGAGMSGCIRCRAAWTLFAYERVSFVINKVYQSFVFAPCTAWTVTPKLRLPNLGLRLRFSGGFVQFFGAGWAPACWPHLATKVAGHLQVHWVATLFTMVYSKKTSICWLFMQWELRNSGYVLPILPVVHVVALLMWLDCNVRC